MQPLAHHIHTHVTEKTAAGAPRRVAVVPHKNPDGDTLGAATAFLEYLRSYGVDATLWCKTTYSSALAFLPHADELRSDPQLWREKQFDTVCIFDAGDPVFAGVQDCIDSLDKKPFIINFDHHFTNTNFGNYNFVQVTAASTTEVLHNYFQHIGHRINSTTATSLLTGLMTDTGNFSNPATSASALATGGALMKAGGNYGAILNYTYRNKTLDGLKLWGIALSRLQIKPELDLAYTVLTRADIESLKVTDGDVEGVANFLNSIGETKIALVLKETQDGFVKGSLRTTHDDVDVSAIAAMFGGGGHKKASGFSVRGKLAEVGGEWTIVSE
ncbi:MAG: bifunctional oligoribonuclease/PAP phosphatase NrnA [Candidatus Magasanikbacteria bacterium]|nr:bifunctional oligoribonuclease/PAP phosphatase NrnA [Candidatus Magasanikbacteria bacterium]